MFRKSVFIGVWEGIIQRRPDIRARFGSLLFRWPGEAIQQPSWEIRRALVGQKCPSMHGFGVPEARAFLGRPHAEPA